MTHRNLPIVAIIGRPNVGKSTLFNRIAGKRKAHVLETPGLTRDRNYAEAEWNGKAFFLVDTGGYDVAENDELTHRIREQALMAIEEASLIIFLADVQNSNNPVDFEMINILRRSQKSFVLAVNKCDNTSLEQQAYAFSAFGVSSLYPLSAIHGIGTGNLLDAVIAELPGKESAFEEDRDTIRIAVVGRQNVGKSTLVNKILGKDRVIASSVPGTTRDAIDTPVKIGKKKYLIIDTAGIRRRGKIERGPEHLSVTSSIMSIQRCDVAVLLLDAGSETTSQDTHIGGYISEAGCAVLLVVNKWDLITKDNSTAGEYAKNLKREFNFISFAPILFISSLTGQRVRRIFSIIDEIMPQYNASIPTSQLNNQFEEIIKRHPPPLVKGRRLK